MAKFLLSYTWIQGAGQGRERDHTMIRCFAPVRSVHAFHNHTIRFVTPKLTANSSSSSLLSTRREALTVSIVTTTLEILISSFSASSSAAAAELLELPNSGGVKALDLRLGRGPVPVDGDQVI